MIASKQARQDAKIMFRGCLGPEGVLDEEKVKKVVAMILERKPRNYLVLLGQFKRLIHLALEQRSVRVESAVSLDSQAQDLLKERLTRSYGKGLEFSFSENASLIGGMRIQVGSDVYDGSVRSRLERLKDSF